MKDFSKNIKEVLLSLKIGQSVEYPITRENSVKVMASRLGKLHNKKFKTSIDWEKKIITVTRVRLSK